MAIFTAGAFNLFMFFLTSYYLFDPMPYFLGLETRQRYISRLAPAQPAFDFVDSQADAQKALLVSIHEPYYLKHPFFFSSFADPPVAEVMAADAKSPDEIAAKFHQLGITHIIFNTERYKIENDERLYSWTLEKRILFEKYIRQCRGVRTFGSITVFKAK